MVALMLSWAWGATKERFDPQAGLRAAGVCRILGSELPSSVGRMPCRGRRPTG
ncbi:hypothetical protein ACFQU7_06375 [Pseudoroseomonas wenyumeiae]